MLLLSLALFFSVASQPEKNIGLKVAFTTPTPDPETGPDVEQEVVKIDLVKPSESALDMTAEDASTDLTNELANLSNNTPTPVLEQETSNVDSNRNPSVIGNLPTLPTGGGLEGRGVQSRSKLAAARGGTAGSEAAVEEGLAWIINHQRADGSWRLQHNCPQCNGQCRNEGKMRSPTAATGLALMSLLGAGYTHQAGPYQEQVRAGLSFLIKSMFVDKKGGSLILKGGGKADMYAQAIATIALAECFAMTGDQSLLEPVALAQQFIESVQDDRTGSWGYVPGTAGDLTITSWQIAALKSCKMAGLKYDPEVWDKAESFVDSTTDTAGLFGYQDVPPTKKRLLKLLKYNLPTTTAIGTLAKMYMGAPLESPELGRATGYVADSGVSKTDIYFNYYATQVMRHRGGPEWKIWNAEMRDHLINSQDQSSMHSRGSWYFPDKNGQMGGRLYTTAMAVMTLEVYYRYLPLYGEKSLIDDEL
jgi:hypothetical protein